MNSNEHIDHLFRHQFGKMVGVLTKIFGLAHIETIEDAVQDTFIKAVDAWKEGMPPNPEGWLMMSAKNRVIDLFRSLKSERERKERFYAGPSSIAISQVFLDHEVEDAQLRMIFTACHPILAPKEQIAFALKTVAGFSQKEIAAGLLMKEETIKKRLQRARQTIRNEGISFRVPIGQELIERKDRVLEVLYLIFNEGFHSTQQESLIHQDLCAEAMRLTQLLLKNPVTEDPKTHALFALMCFHASRLDSKVDAEGILVDLEHQDRSLWVQEYQHLGNIHMHKAVATEDLSAYHFEAAVAAEHLKAQSFEETDWKQIAYWYQKLQEVAPSSMVQLNLAVVHLQMKDHETAESVLNSMNQSELQQRGYLWHALNAEILFHKGQIENALIEMHNAIELTNNTSEKGYLRQKKEKWESHLN
ncbi:MAG: sigma-70 family RNA polymerase sigma factor [Bacteroidota bacterium]